MTACALYVAEVVTSQLLIAYRPWDVSSFLMTWMTAGACYHALAAGQSTEKAQDIINIGDKNETSAAIAPPGLGRGGGNDAHGRPGRHQCRSHPVADGAGCIAGPARTEGGAVVARIDRRPQAERDGA